MFANLIAFIALFALFDAILIWFFNMVGL